MIGCQRIPTSQKVVFWANTRNKTDHTMWKGIENCARKWCLFCVPFCLRSLGRFERCDTSCNNIRRNECEMAAYVSIKWDIKYTVLRWGGGISGPIFAQMLLISRGSHHSIDEKCRILKERQILYAILNKDFCSYGRGTTASLSAPLKTTLPWKC